MASTATTKIDTVTATIPSLHSQLIGEIDRDHGIVHFRGIPYATVTERWTHSRPLHQLNEIFDATRYGPRCEQPADGLVLVTGGTNDPTPGDDEFGCLNLNISVPAECLDLSGTTAVKKGVPVMFWIHGQVSTSTFVARRTTDKDAAKSGHPIVLVQINYRLGVLGFAASQDLSPKVAHDGDPQDSIHSVPGNFGFVDQRNALIWVRDHIRDFGGDPENVTAFGISAGSASVHHHILTGSPMFDRGICMSGSAPSLGPLPMAQYEVAWQGLVHSFGLESASREDRLSTLRSKSVREIMSKYPDGPIGPAADGILLPENWTFTTPNSTRCRALIIGDTNTEAVIFDGMFKQIPPSRFMAIARSVMSSAEVDTLTEVFDFPKDDSQEGFTAYRDAMRRFMSLALFQYPSLRIAETFKSAGGDAAYLYHVEETSPFPGPTFGLSYHGYCALLMYCMENDTLPAESQFVAETLACKWTAFAHGVEPWEPYTASERFMRFGPVGKIGLHNQANDETRRGGDVDWFRLHFDEAKTITQAFLHSAR